MLEVGSSYKIVTLEHGQNHEGKWSLYETSQVYEIAAVEGPLVKLLGPDYSKLEFDDLLSDEMDRDKPREEVVLNTAGLFFVRAEKQQR